ncbi:MAG TPA: hypothetical protein QF698_08215, partial [Candidatus Marinimicrobia bacterium]|nr:hypothetical protein [Candidatus Neomarinimicrobiota bacterium]
MDVDDCAGDPGGDAVCGCTDSTASNFDTLATFDDGSCVDCAGVAGGDNICGCTDSTATNYDSLATYDDNSCEFLLNGVPIKWIRTYDGDESWCVNTVSDGGFIIAGATNYTGQIIKTDSNGEKEWHQLYDNSTSLYSVRQTADGGFIATGYYECDTLPGCYPDIYLLKTNSSGTIEWEISDGT